MWRLLGDASSMADLGAAFERGLTDAEMTSLREEKRTKTAKNVLRRRSRLGRHLSPGSVERVEMRMKAGPQALCRVAE